MQIGNDWKVYRVDFSRAFRQDKNLQNTKNLVRCDRKLFAKLKVLDGNELQQKTKGYLNKGEALARRDKIVDYFQKLIVEAKTEQNSTARQGTTRPRQRYLT